ncbi:MAG: hypothetical protein AB1486_24670 [Planctomycetota bacterium]
MRRVCILAAVLLAASCSAPETAVETSEPAVDVPGQAAEAGADESPTESPGDYLEDRLLDLLDVVSARFIFGPGLRFNARVTEIFQVGAGSTGTVAPPDSFTLEAHTIGTMRREGGVWTSRVSEAGISLFYSYDSEGSLIKGNKSYFGEAERGFFDVGFAVHAALIGVEAEARPDELFDFVLGFFGFDYMGDDLD